MVGKISQSGDVTGWGLKPGTNAVLLAPGQAFPRATKHKLQGIKNNHVHAQLGQL